MRHRDRDGTTASRRWAELRFSIIGPLLASPPTHGELRARLEELASECYCHPTTGETVHFGVSTLERWYYAAKAARDPIAALERKVHPQAGKHPAVSERVAQLIRNQHRDHPRWSYQLHHENLVALIGEDRSLGQAPSYPTLVRFMKSAGLERRKKKRRDELLPGGPRERRRFEVEYVSGLWHLDFHEAKRSVSLPSGDRQRPVLLGVLDDRSRLCCHLQWYLSETAECLVHGLSQAFQKRGLPRALLTDNGAAMIAEETEQGLRDLSIIHFTTLAETPEQNGKQESFWGQIEGRLMPMLEGVEELTLALLNEATQAFYELDYNQRIHSETKHKPIDRFVQGPDVSRPCPSSQQLRRAFRLEGTRSQRKSDGTISVEGKRFELPTRYRTFRRVTVRYARWDLSCVDLVDPKTHKFLCTLYPVDLAKNADGIRRPLDPVEHVDALEPRPCAGVAPRLRQLMADYAATGLPPAYLPLDQDKEQS